MALIPGAQDLGQRVARPANFNETQTPHDAFGASFGQAVQSVGANMASAEAQAEAQAAAEAKRQKAIADAETRRLLAQEEAERKAADKAQALTVMQRAADALTLDADDFGQGILGGSIDKGKAAEDWGTRSRTKITEALADVPEVHRAAVMHDLEHRSALLGRTKIGGALRQRNRDEARGGIDQTMEYAQRLYASDPVGAEKLMAGTIDSLGPAAGLGADDIARRKQAWREVTQFTSGYEAISAGRDDPKALDRAESLIRALPDIDPQRRAQLMDRAAAYRLAIDQRRELGAQRAERERDRVLKRAEHEFNAFQAMADKGTMLDPAYIDRVAQATAGTPYQAAIRALAEQARANGGLAAQPIAAQQAALDRINAEIAQRGRSPALDKRKEQIEKVVRGSIGDRERDPLRAGLERGVIDALPPLNMAGGVQGLVAQLAGRVDAAQRVQRWAGQPVSPLTADEAATVKAQLDVLPVKERSVLVAGLASAIGPQQAQGLARQMDPKDKALGLAFATAGAQTTEGRFTSELILRGQQAKADGTSTKGQKEPEVKAAGWRAHAAAELDGVFGNAAFTAQVRDAAELIMHGMASEGGGRLSRDDMDRAVRLAIGGTLVEHNGRKIPLPAGIDAGMLEKRLSSVAADEIARQTVVPRADGQPSDLSKATVRAGGVEVPVAQFVQSLPAAPLMPVRPGEFAVLVGGRPVVNAAGVPIVVRVRP